MQIFHVSPLAVLVSALAQWLLGALWYGFVFRARWKALVGIPESEKPNNAWFPMVVSFIANLVLSMVLAHLVKWSGATALPRGIAKRSIGRLRLRGKENETEIYTLATAEAATRPSGEVAVLSSGSR